MTLKLSDFGGLFSYPHILTEGANGDGKSSLAPSLFDWSGLPVFHNHARALDRA
jgi:hypothetical protein